MRQTTEDPGHAQATPTNGGTLNPVEEPLVHLSLRLSGRLLTDLGHIARHVAVALFAVALACLMVVVGPDRLLEIAYELTKPVSTRDDLRRRAVTLLNLIAEVISAFRQTFD